MRKLLSSSLALAFCTALPAVAQVDIDSNTFGGLEARALGPAVMGGRISSMAVVRGERLTVYVGTAGGGVWKSDDGATTFTPIFDEHAQAIGAVTVDPGDAETVWVGTGESWTRRGVAIGDGVYKSTDGGESWQHVGLADSGRIARIAVSPADSDTVYVCATGPLWGESEERGLYRTTDGGESWQRLLYVDASTGCSDVALDPQEPQVVYAGMWEYRHGGDFFRSGGPGSGLYRSTDGGDSFSELTEGLPDGEKGRIAVAVAPSRPSRVYALIEGKPTALFRSDDLGASWQRLDSSFNLGYFPFFLAHLVVDPSDFDRVYKPGLTLTVSTDGGASFTSPFTGGFGGGLHPDHHALWIDPDDPRHLLLGTDGGVYVSHDRAATWRHVGSLPVSQFYRVSFDDDFPYNVYGGLQDNGGWGGPSRSLGGIENRDWDSIGYGDGFWLLRDPVEPRYVYYDSQRGNILRIDLETQEAREIKPYPGAGEPAYRWHWNTPLLLSPNEPGTLYAGAQYLFRSRDRGESWQRISPDLTRGEPQRAAGESDDGEATVYDIIFGSIYYASESPLDGGVIWVGTDDGNLAVTRDGGGSWQQVADKLPGAPEQAWISSVVASPHAAAGAFATVQGHRSGDPAPYLYETTDYGASWRRLPTDGVEGYAFIVRQDPVAPGLLFLGTEFGLYVSVDGGERWAHFTGNLPPVEVRDLGIHPREGDLVIGTHGRGIYVLDDLTSLRHLTAEVLEQEVALLPSRPAVMIAPGNQQTFAGDGGFIGRNPPEAAWITYYLKKRHLFGDLKVEVYDDSGELIATVPGSKRRGLNRVAWPMRLPPPKVPPADALAPAFLGPRAAEGSYTVKLVKGKTTLAGEVELVPDPRLPHSAEDRAEQQRVSSRLYDLLADLTYLVDAAVDLREQAQGRAEALAGKGRLARRLRDLADELEALRSGLVAEGAGSMLLGEEKLRENLAGLYGSVTGYSGRPTRTQLDRMATYEAELAAARERFDALLPAAEELGPQLQRHQLEPLAPLSRERWEEQQDGA